jgi:hypothetical protein
VDYPSPYPRFPKGTNINFLKLICWIIKQVRNKLQKNVGKIVFSFPEKIKKLSDCYIFGGNKLKILYHGKKVRTPRKMKKKNLPRRPKKKRPKSD